MPPDDDGPPDRGASSRAESPATEVLRLAVNRPETVSEWLDEALFEDGVHRDTYRALVESATIHQAIETAPPEVAALLSRLAVEEPVDDPLDPVIQLLRLAGRRLLAVERSRESGDLEAMTTLAGLVAQLDAGDERREAAASELLTFVTQQGATS